MSKFWAKSKSGLSYWLKGSREKPWWWDGKWHLGEEAQKHFNSGGSASDTRIFKTKTKALKALYNAPKGSVLTIFKRGKTGGVIALQELVRL